MHIKRTVPLFSRKNAAFHIWLHPRCKLLENFGKSQPYMKSHFDINSGQMHIVKVDDRSYYTVDKK